MQKNFSLSSILHIFVQTPSRPPLLRQFWIVFYTVRYIFCTTPYRLVCILRKFKLFLLLSLPAGRTWLRVTRPRLWVRRRDHPPPHALTTSLLFCPHHSLLRRLEGWYFYWRPPKPGGPPAGCDGMSRRGGAVTWGPATASWPDVPRRSHDGMSRDGVMTGCPARALWQDVPCPGGPTLTNNGRISYPKVVEQLNLFLCVFFLP